MQMKIEHISGSKDRFVSVEDLRNALQGVAEDGNGNLVSVGKPVEAELTLLLTGVTSDAFGQICELVESHCGTTSVSARVAA